MTILSRKQYEDHGWRRPPVRNPYQTELWTHDDHQPDGAGFFTKGGALKHQIFLDHGGTCFCVPKEFKLHE